VDENEEEGPKVPVKETFSRILSDIEGIKGWYYLGIFGGLLAGGTIATFAFLFGDMVQILDSEHVERDSWKILLMFMTMGTFYGLGNYIQFYCFIRFAGLIAAHLRVSYFNSLMNMEKAFFDKESTGGLSAKLISEMKSIEVGMGNQFGQGWQFLGMFLGGFTIAFYESWLFTLILMGLFPVVAIAGGIGGKIISNLSKKGVDIYEDASNRSKEILSGILTVKSLTAELSEASFYRKLIAGGLPLMKKKAIRVGGAMGVMNFFNIGFFYAVGMYLGALQVSLYNRTGGNEGFGMDEVFAAFFGVFLGGMGLGTIFTVVPDVIGGLTAIQGLYAIIDRVPKIRQPEGGASPIKMRISGQITFENVSFAYPTRPELYVLHDINMEIKPGQIVALVGPSGCGKSTTVSLIERFYDLDQECGKIMAEGIPIWNLDIEDWRNQIGYVGQEPVLFDGSITENILLGTDGRCSEQDAINAAKEANAHGFIEEFPQKYNTKVGEGGSALSGGQKQRIAIARALVRKPQILLLDEATSALDTESERVVQAALDKILSEGTRTCIVIAHRLSTITNADMIFVFKDGRIIQQGGYQELANDKKGVFYAMLKAQDVLGVDALKKREMSRDISMPVSVRQASIRSQ